MVPVDVSQQHTTGCLKRHRKHARSWAQQKKGWMMDETGGRSSNGGAFGSLSARFLCSSMNMPTLGSCPGPIVMTGSPHTLAHLHISGGILHCVSSGIGPIGICSGVMSYAVISSSPPPSSS
uniref:Uncharacterized protein n=1 Tax=Anopheles coluzzii TaxID=1518534 RepID=A0A8W7P7N6_ANOCL